MLSFTDKFELGSVEVKDISIEKKPPRVSVHFDIRPTDSVAIWDSESIVVHVPIDEPFDTALVPDTVNQARRVLAKILSDTAERLRIDATTTLR